MEVSERLKRIANAKERMDREAHEAETKERMEEEEFCNKWLVHTKRIKDMLVVANELCEQNITIGKLRKIHGWPTHEFVSNGIEHNFGFIAHAPFNQSQSLGIYGIGIKGGGMCGTDFVLDGNGVAQFSYYNCRDWDPKYRERRLCFEKLEKTFLELEREFYKYVDSL